MLLEPGNKVFLVPPQIDVVRTVNVESIRDEGGGKAIVRFREVDSIDVAEKLVGMHCLIDRSDVEEYDDVLDSAAKDALAGWEFVDDASGRSGRIIRSWSASGNLLGEVAMADEDDSASTRLIPLAGDFIKERDADSKRLVLELPNGIFEI